MCILYFPIWWEYHQVLNMNNAYCVLYFFQNEIGIWLQIHWKFEQRLRNIGSFLLPSDLKWFQLPEHFSNENERAKNNLNLQSGGMRALRSARYDTECIRVSDRALIFVSKCCFHVVNANAFETLHGADLYDKCETSTIWCRAADHAWSHLPISNCLFVITDREIAMCWTEFAQRFIHRSIIK